ncbi:MAG: (2Fe-2S)-binding protein [Chloroflexi bacterium]|nr:(2Fe-2S)-binding protein [Chloroflexota bacterium]
MAKQIFRLKVNGDNYEVFVEPNRCLHEVIRDEIGLTGTKEGCGTGDCGACTLWINGAPVTSCLMLVGEGEGAEVTTIEGLARDGELHPVQKAFIQHGALQCGFCIPGMIMSAAALLRDNPHPSELEIRQGIAGNLCRCTGYTKIVEAIEAVAAGSR